MGFFSDIVSGVSDFIGGGDGLRAIADIGGAAAGIIGANRAADAAKDAQSKARRAFEDQSAAARQEFRQASQRGIDAIRAGTNAFQETISPMMASPDRLTPAQQIARDDLLRDGRAVLASSGLRGAGRAGVGQILEADRRFLADAAERNQGRSDRARSALANVLAQEGGSIANTEIGTGNRIGESLTSQAGVASNAALNQGAITAGQTLDTANLVGGALGTTLGTLGSVIADDMKRRSTGVSPTT